MEFPFEKMAMNEEPMPRGLDVADACLYMGLRYLYAMYKRKLIDRGRATEEKKRLVFNWAEGKKKLEFLDRESKVLRDRIELASKEYSENPTIQNADLLYAAFYNLPKDWREKK